MRDKTRKFLFLFLSFFCFGQGFANVHSFHPPLLSVDDPFIDFHPNTFVHITCSGKHSVTWKTPLTEMGVSTNDSRYSILSFMAAPSETVNKYHSTITLEDLDFKDTGYYSCYYEGTTDFSLPDNVTSLYVFVNDPINLFVENSAFIAGHLLIPLQQHKKSVIPCLPTSSLLNVTLWKTESEDDEGEMVTLGTDVTYDPRIGFTIYYPTMYFNGFFQCRTHSANASETINLTLFYMADTYNAPLPFINSSSAQHPVVNDTFILTCMVDVDPDTRLFIDWNYPNKNNSAHRVNETQPFSVWKTTRGYKHQEVATSLVVKNAEVGDSGTYACTVTDHSHKTGRAEVNIYVYESKQPMHVNFTTDIDTSQPILAESGEDVRFVITVQAFPSLSDVELYWEKDGKFLEPDKHYRMNKTNSTVVLEIKQLTRFDAATYVLHGRTKDTNSSISILLEVKEEPSVFLHQTQTVYMVGQEYTLECHAEGFPAPIVWWRWKPCPSSGECTPGYSQGWRDVEAGGNFPNNENITLEYSDEKSLSLLSSMHLTANQSGHYKCIASNVMGKDDEITPFVVTDADEGFQISLSTKKPVDMDLVELGCKVNTYNFSSIEWKWRSIFFEGWMPLENSTDMVINNYTSPYSHVSVVTFNPMRLRQSGEYACVAKSFCQNRTQMKHIIIDVREVKKPLVNNTNMRGVSFLTAPGSLQEFYCYADGVPFPNITWRKDGKDFDVSNMSGVEITDKDQRLTIRRVLSRDVGFYQCVISNRGGLVETNATLEILLEDDIPQAPLTTGEIIAIVIVGMAVVALVLLISCLVQRIRKDRKQKKELDFVSHSFFERGYTDLFNPNLPLEDQIDLLPYKHNYEFPKERLKLGKTLGQGAFGRVVKAEAIGMVEGEVSTTVAVKMLKEAADMEQRKALISELKILIHIGKHLNIVNLLGAVTKHMAKGELYVIVEYCCLGNLRHFLLKHKSSFIDQLDHSTGQLDPQISTLPGSPFINITDNMVTYSNILGIGMDNPSYREQPLNYADLSHQQVTNDSGTGMSVLTCPSGSTQSERYLRSSPPAPVSFLGNDTWNEETVKNSFITTCDLLCFAFQCARGMEYLASRKLIHRDLAARNVLLSEDNVVKLCDFGLAKDCYKYVKKTNGLLPVKWMAIESIRDKVFTTKSDVWSYGVFLWELFTLGSNPYPGVEINEEFFKKLRNGYRMEKPELSPENVYQLMKKCWSDDPSQRPEFSQLTETIGAFLESSVRKFYVELNTPYQTMNEEIFSNNNDYLQMTGDSKEDYTNMVNFNEPTSAQNNVRNLPSSENSEIPTRIEPMIRLKDISLSQNHNNRKRRFSSELSDDRTDITYLNMASSPEEYDAVFLEREVQGKVAPRYQNGTLRICETEMNTRC